MYVRRERMIFLNCSLLLVIPSLVIFVDKRHRVRETDGPEEGAERKV